MKGVQYPHFTARSHTTGRGGYGKLLDTTTFFRNLCDRKLLVVLALKILLFYFRYLDI